MKKKLFGVVALIAIAIILLTMIDINTALSKFEIYRNIKSNINFFIKVFNRTLPVLAIFIVIIAYKILNNKWVFRIEKFNLGGISVICNNPEDIFKQQVKNFLNTKRTLFKFDEEKDNFYETIDSYYEIYKFLRDEMKIYDVKSSSKPSQNDTENCYNTANTMIKTLNEFLTKHQSDLRRWYEYIINNKAKEIHNVRIDDIQRNYFRYDEIIEDFKKLNTVFCSLAYKFEIDYDKWSKEKATF